MYELTKLNKFKVKDKIDNIKLEVKDLNNTNYKINNKNSSLSNISKLNYNDDILIDKQNSVKSMIKKDVIENGINFNHDITKNNNINNNKINSKFSTFNNLNDFNKNKSNILSIIESNFNLKHKKDWIEISFKIKLTENEYKSLVMQKAKSFTIN